MLRKVQRLHVFTGLPGLPVKGDTWYRAESWYWYRADKGGEDEGGGCDGRRGGGRCCGANTDGDETAARVKGRDDGNDGDRGAEAETTERDG